MRIDLTNRTALVTGSTAGIGRAIAVALVQAGARVVVNGRDAERTAQAARMIAEEAEVDASVVTPQAADVGTASGCAQLIAAVPDVDVLVNNAGIFHPKPVFEITDEDWLEHFEINVMSGIRLARHHAPRMRERGWGRVVFIASESAIQVPTEGVQYGVTKTAQLAVSRGMAQELAGTGVTVNAVLPGPTLTASVTDMLGSADDSYDELVAKGREFIATSRSTSLLGRLLEPAEVAHLVVYVASPLSSATTGAALRVDGGVVQSLV